MEPLPGPCSRARRHVHSRFRDHRQPRPRIPLRERERVPQEVRGGVRPLQLLLQPRRRAHSRVRQRAPRRHLQRRLRRGLRVLAAELAQEGPQLRAGDLQHPLLLPHPPHGRHDHKAACRVQVGDRHLRPHPQDREHLRQDRQRQDRLHLRRRLHRRALEGPHPLGRLPARLQGLRVRRRNRQPRVLQEHPVPRLLPDAHVPHHGLPVLHDPRRLHLRLPVLRRQLHSCQRLQPQERLEALPEGERRGNVHQPQAGHLVRRLGKDVPLQLLQQGQRRGQDPPHPVLRAQGPLRQSERGGHGQPWLHLFVRHFHHLGRHPRL